MGRTLITSSPQSVTGQSAPQSERCAVSRPTRGLAARDMDPADRGGFDSGVADWLGGDRVTGTISSAVSSVASFLHGGRTTGLVSPGAMIQRKCACGEPAATGGQCSACRMAAHVAPAQAASGLSLNDPADAREGEADRVAQTVVGTGEASFHTLNSAVGAAGTIQRSAIAPIDRADHSDAPDRDDGVDLVSRFIQNSAGRPLDERTLSFMESRFGQDFSNVRIHTGSTAAESARAISARAYTVGPHVVFSDGAFAPSTPQGRQLLAHELTHVVQQGGKVVTGARPEVALPGDKHEAEADRAANALAGPSVPSSFPLPAKPSRSSALGPTVQREIAETAPLPLSVERNGNKFQVIAAGVVIARGQTQVGADLQIWSKRDGNVVSVDALLPTGGTLEPTPDGFVRLAKLVPNLNLSVSSTTDKSHFQKQHSLADLGLARNTPDAEDRGRIPLEDGPQVITGSGALPLDVPAERDPAPKRPRQLQPITAPAAPPVATREPKHNEASSSDHPVRDFVGGVVEGAAGAAVTLAVIVEVAGLVALIPVVGQALVLLAGAFYLGYSIGKAFRARKDQKQTTKQALDGAVGDVTGLSDIYAGVTGNDVETGKSLALTPSQRGQRFGSGVVTTATLGAGAVKASGPLKGSVPLEGTIVPDEPLNESITKTDQAQIDAMDNEGGNQQQGTQVSETPLVETTEPVSSAADSRSSKAIRNFEEQIETKAGSEKQAPEPKSADSLVAEEPVVRATAGSTPFVAKPGEVVDPTKVDVYRGGTDMTIKPGEIRIDKSTGLVKPTRGPSVNTNPADKNVVKNGGPQKIAALPDELQIKAGDRAGTHLEIVPKQPMTPARFQELLNQIDRGQ